MGNLPTYITLEECFFFFFTMDDTYSQKKIISVKVKLSMHYIDTFQSHYTSLICFVYVAAVESFFF